MCFVGSEINILVWQENYISMLLIILFKRKINNGVVVDEYHLYPMKINKAAVSNPHLVFF